MLPIELTYTICTSFTNYHSYIYDFELFEKMMLVNKQWNSNFSNRNLIVNDFIKSFYKNSMPEFINDIDYKFLKKLTHRYPYVLATIHSLRLYNTTELKNLLSRELGDYYNFHKHGTTPTVKNFLICDYADFNIGFEFMEDIDESNEYLGYIEQTSNYKFKYIHHLTHEYIYKTLISNDVDVIKFMFKVLDYYNILQFYENNLRIFSNISAFEIFSRDDKITSVETLKYYLDFVNEKTPRFFNGELLEIFNYMVHFENIECITYMLDTYNLQNDLAISYFRDEADTPITFYTILNHPKFINYKNIINLGPDLFNENMSELDCKLVYIFIYSYIIVRTQLLPYNINRFSSIMKEVMYLHRQLFIHDDNDDNGRKIAGAFNALKNTIFKDNRIPREGVKDFIDGYIFGSLTLVREQLHTRKLVLWLFKLSEEFDMFGPIDLRSLNSKIRILQPCIGRIIHGTSYTKILKYIIEYASYEAVVYLIRSKNSYNNLTIESLEIAKTHAESLNKTKIVEFITCEILLFN